MRKEERDKRERKQRGSSSSFNFILETKKERKKERKNSGGACMVMMDEKAKLIYTFLLQPTLIRRKQLDTARIDRAGPLSLGNRHSKFFPDSFILTRSSSSQQKKMKQENPSLLSFAFTLS